MLLKHYVINYVNSDANGNIKYIIRYKQEKYLTGGVLDWEWNVFECKAKSKQDAFYMFIIANPNGGGWLSKSDVKYSNYKRNIHMMRR